MLPGLVQGMGLEGGTVIVSSRGACLVKLFDRLQYVSMHVTHFQRGRTRGEYLVDAGNGSHDRCGLILLLGILTLAVGLFVPRYERLTLPQSTSCLTTPWASSAWSLMSEPELLRSMSYKAAWTRTGVVCVPRLLRRSQV